MFSFLRKKEPVKAKRSGLGLDEKKHIRCKYKNKKKCPQDCAECCFSIKLKGDFMMQVQAYDSAAELYEDAVSRSRTMRTPGWHWATRPPSGETWDGRWRPMRRPFSLMIGLGKRCMDELWR